MHICTYIQYDIYIYIYICILHILTQDPLDGDGTWRCNAAGLWRMFSWLQPIDRLKNTNVYIYM